MTVFKKGPWEMVGETCWSVHDWDHRMRTGTRDLPGEKLRNHDKTGRKDAR